LPAILLRMPALFHSSADRVSTPDLRSYASHFAIGFASMLLLGLAFPSPGWWPLAHVALAPITLLAAWAHSTNRLFWTSFLASYAWWLIMLSWLIGVTGGGYAALAAYMAVYLPLYLVLWRLIDRRFRLPAVLTVPLVFVPLEYIRGTFLQGGMAWFGLGHSQAPYLPGQATLWFIEVADLAGDWTVSFLVAMTNGLIVDFVRWKFNRSRSTRALTAFVAIWASAFGGALWWGFLATNVNLALEKLGPTNIQVALIQTNVSQDNKMRPKPGQLMADWNRMVELTQQALAANPKIEIVVWPETMVPVPINPEALDVYRRLQREGKGGEDLFFHEQVGQLAATHKVHFFVGSGAIQFQPTRRYNSAFHYLPDGSQAADSYSKIDRVPFGEYIPWVEDWPWLKEMFLKYLSPYGPGNDYTLTPGERRTVFTVTRGDGSTVRVTVPICFEDAFARSTLALCYDRSGKRCDLMLNLTNDGWYPGTDQGLQHVQMAVMRSIETRVPMARSVNTGVSVFIDSCGRVGPFVTGSSGEIQQIDGFAISEITLDPRSSTFGSVGAIPVRLLTLAMAILAVIAFMHRHALSGPRRN